MHCAQGFGRSLGESLAPGPTPTTPSERFPSRRRLQISSRPPTPFPNRWAHPPSGLCASRSLKRCPSDPLVISTVATSAHSSSRCTISQFRRKICLSVSASPYTERRLCALCAGYPKATSILFPGAPSLYRRLTCVAPALQPTLPPTSDFAAPTELFCPAPTLQSLPSLSSRRA